MEKAPSECCISVQAAAIAKALFGIVYQTMCDRTAAKISIRKEVLKSYDFAFAPVAKLFFSVVCPSIFPSEVVEEYQQISLSRGLSLDQILRGKSQAKRPLVGAVQLPAKK